jgi:hypothetical protein
MKTNKMSATCDCGEEIDVLDASGYSATMCCPHCCRDALRIHHPDFQATISLRDFSRKRGDQPHQRPLDNLSMAEGLVDALILDAWPSPATVLDFGIDSAEHLGALQHAVRSGITAYDLDRVVGDGQAITRLVRSVPHQPYHEVTFVTAYDRVEWDFGDATLADRWLALDDIEV